MDILFVVGRILYGGFFLVQGLGLIKSSAKFAARLRMKRFPYAHAIVILAGILLVSSGLGVLSGHYTNISLALGVVALSFVSFTANDYWNYIEPSEINQHMSIFIRNLALVGAALMLFSVLQPWSFSL